MCEDCDAVATYLETVRGNISEDGWVVLPVDGDRHRPPYAYTAGLTEHGLPELVVTGLPSIEAARLMESVVGLATEGGEFRPGERLVSRKGPPIEVVEVAQPSVHLLVAHEFYGAEVRAQQLVYADERERWPWNRSFRDGRGGQPVLGARAAPHPAWSG